MLSDKVVKAVDLIKESMHEDSNPVILSSFGKDSMVMLDLIKRAGFKFPILFFKEPFFPKKYQFANEVILANNYTVYDYPPMGNSVSKHNGTFEVINHHQVRELLETLYLPTGIMPPISGEEYLCGLEDIYSKPKGSFRFPWNLIFCGHKSSDVDLILGNLPLKDYSFRFKDQVYVYPLRDFTDVDIWEYTLEYNLPINHKRYNKDDNFREFKDITYNPDYFPACVRCMDRDAEARVLCPKVNKIIPNISGQLAYYTPDLSHYVENYLGEIN